jgi:hypothetical protein
MTLRYECPACHHEQRRGGRCENCGVDFLKYAVAVVSVKKASTDAAREKAERRSTLLKGLMLAPFTAGLPLLRQLLRDRKRD